MPRRGLPATGLFALLLLAAGPLAVAQEAAPPPSAAPAHLSFIDGAATLEREGQAQPATADMPLLQGDRVRTDDGRVEMLFPDGSLLHLDQHTTVDLLSDALIRLLDGRLILVVRGNPDEQPSIGYQVDAPTGSVRIARPGEYHVSLFGSGATSDVELAVSRGEATLVSERGSVPLRAGERSAVGADAAPQAPVMFNSARWDAFDRWSEQQRGTEVGGRSGEYLPPDLQAYSGTFDRYGSWETLPPYGSVWYPSAPIGWRPYYDGYWSSVGVLGWNWIGYDPWAWPTHHYGRWGFHRSRWFWIPGRVWGPAWVSWGIAPGYVSWCPLGWNDRPVIDLVFAGGYGRYGGLRDPWHAWTVVPHASFGLSVRVGSVAVAGHVLAAHRPAFVTQRMPPAIARSQPVGSPRDSAIATAAGHAVPRTTPQGWGTVRTPRDSGVAVRSAAPQAGRSGLGVSARPRAMGPTAPPAWMRESAVNRSDSPYDRAARVAAERGTGTPGAVGAMPRGDRGPVSSGSPYPERYRAPVPEPFQYRPSGPAAAPRMPDRPWSTPTMPRGGFERPAYPGSSSAPYPRQYAPRGGYSAPAPRGGYTAPAAPRGGYSAPRGGSAGPAAPRGGGARPAHGRRR